ncbi:MAG: TlpA family protein disulfide reductase [Acidimicrobiales bacterium]|nr:TlpA family protein disulfide reductase [Acidimicrobiales bacterium]
MTSRSKTQSTNAKTLLIWLGGAVAVIGLVAIVVAGAGSVDNSGHPDLQGDPQIVGDSLAALPSGAQVDPAAGEPVPEVNGADFDGTPVSITDNGKAKIIVFLAHWCPNCQQEVPEVTEWLEQNTVPDNVEILSVATSISSARDNFPPSDWLEDENWPVPVVLDSVASDIGVAYGVSAFPLWAMVDVDGNLVTRITGAGQVDLNFWTNALAAA